MKPRPSSVAAVSSCLALCLAAPSALAQQASQTGPPVVLQTGTQLVVLDVTVLDKSGRLVTEGISRDEFHITEDKQPQTIRDFQPPAEHTETGQGRDLPTIVFVLDEADSVWLNGDSDIEFLTPKKPTAPSSSPFSPISPKSCRNARRSSSSTTGASNRWSNSRAIATSWPPPSPSMNPGCPPPTVIISRSPQTPRPPSARSTRSGAWPCPCVPCQAAKASSGSASAAPRRTRPACPASPVTSGSRSRTTSPTS